MSDTDVSATADAISSQHVAQLFGAIATRSNADLISLFTASANSAGLAVSDLKEFADGRSIWWGINAGPGQSFAIGLRSCVELPDALAITARCIGPERGFWTIYQVKDRINTLYGVAPYSDRPAGQTVTAVLADVLGARDRIMAKIRVWMEPNHVITSSADLKRFCSAVISLGLERRLKPTTDGFGVVEMMGKRSLLLEPTRGRAVFTHQGHNL